MLNIATTASPATIAMTTEILSRSTTKTSVGLLGYIILGALAGWIASKIMNTEQGFVLNVVVGIAGALLGGFLMSFAFDTASGGWWFTFFTAILGSVILLYLIRLLQGRR